MTMFKVNKKPKDGDFSDLDFGALPSISDLDLSIDEDELNKVDKTFKPKKSRKPYLHNHLNPAPKKTLIQFVQAILQQSKKEYTFLLVGNKEDAAVYVQRMRSELSRIRKRVMKAGKRPDMFKMYMIDLTTTEEGVEVTLSISAKDIEYIDDRIDLFTAKD